MRPYRTSTLAPWDIFFYDIEYTNGGPKIVDLVLFNGVSGNSTSLFEDPYDLSARSLHKLGFDVPVVPTGTASGSTAGSPPTLGITSVITSTSETHSSPPSSVGPPDSSPPVTITKLVVPALSTSPLPQTTSSQSSSSSTFFWIALCTSRLAAFRIEVEPYDTDRPAPGETIFYNVFIEPGDPRVVDFVLYNGDLDNSTIIFHDLRLVGDEDASGFDIPFVPPGKKYTGRLTRPNTGGRTVFIESAPFEIWPAGTLPSTATPSG
ncbi:hypothetical protein CVT24_002924 [Panaeolus cyanescens]|uniref:Uncharacterized protein n=1 Tax=Panaeolus cyanescens TaxID=181874 RepID=A0A409X247_9AGAR|nr:hypothetical protein CVT24_002924 [Panaeolus cyanescens]